MKKVHYSKTVPKGSFIISNLFMSDSACGLVWRKCTDQKDQVNVRHVRKS